MTLPRTVFESVLLALLAGWRPRSAFVLAATTVAAGLLARSQVLPAGAFSAIMGVLGLLLGANLLVEWYIERARPRSRLLLASLTLYLLVIIYVARP